MRDKQWWHCDAEQNQVVAQASACPPSLCNVQGQCLNIDFASTKQT